jgi:putative transposase
MTSQPHRKRVRHYDLPGHCHELTFSCYRRQQLLTECAWRVELARAIDNANDRHGWRLTAFVFMPEHLHLLVYPLGASSKVSELLFAIKRPFSYRVKKLLEAEQHPILDKLTVRQRPNVSTFRFWQEGPGFDRNLTTERAILAAIDYLHLNPVRRKLCQQAVDWRWSSARWPVSDGRNVDESLPRLTPLPAGVFHVGVNGTL